MKPTYDEAVLKLAKHMKTRVEKISITQKIPIVMVWFHLEFFIAKKRIVEGSFNSRSYEVSLSFLTKQVLKRTNWIAKTYKTPEDVVWEDLDLLLSDSETREEMKRKRLENQHSIQNKSSVGLSSNENDTLTEVLGVEDEEIGADE